MSYNTFQRLKFDACLSQTVGVKDSPLKLSTNKPGLALSQQASAVAFALPFPLELLLTAVLHTVSRESA